jgi:hypothetical protein
LIALGVSKFIKLGSVLKKEVMFEDIKLTPRMKIDPRWMSDLKGGTYVAL